MIAPTVPSTTLTINRSKRLAATIASGWLRTVVTTAVALVATPILIRYLGSDRFGAAAVATQWFAYLEFLTFGLGAALSVLLLRVATTGNGETVPGTVRAGVSLISRQLLWVLPAAAALVFAFPFVFRLPYPLQEEFYWAAPAILLGVALLPTGVFRSVLEARQQGYLVNLCLTVQAGVVAVVGVGLAVAGAGLTGQIWVSFLGLAVAALLAAHLAGATTRRFWAGSSMDIDRGALSKLRWPLVVAGLGNQINLMSDALLVAMLLGVKAVAGFFLTQRLLQLATVVSGSLSGSGTWAGLVDLRTRDGVEAFRVRLIEVSKLSVGLNLLVLAPAVGLNRRFMALWLRDDTVYAGDAVVLATLAFLGVFNWFCLYAALLDSFGLTRRRVWVSTAGTLIKLALLVPFVSWFGLAGVPMAGVVGYLLTDAWFCPYVLCSEHGVSMRAIGIGLFRATALGGGWVATCFLIANRFAALTGWWGLAAEAAALETGSLLLAWLLLFSTGDRELWRRRVVGWFRRPAMTTRGGSA